MTDLQWTLWLLDRADRAVAEIDAETWQYERRQNQVSTLSFTLSPASVNLEDAWERGSRVRVAMRWLDPSGVWQTADDWGGMILSRGLTKPQEGLPARRFRFTAYNWLHWLRGRLVLPPPATEYLDLNLPYADVAIKTAVRQSLTNPSDPTRLYQASIACQTDANQGSAVKYSARYERLYDVVTTLAGQGGIAFDIVRLGDPGDNTFEFQTYAGQRGVDRTLGNAGGNLPVIFSTMLGSATSLDWTEDALPLANVGYGGGSGEGAERIIGIARDDASIALFDAWETFVEARGAGSTADAQAIAQGVLNDRASPDQQMTFTIPQAGGAVYRRDWDLGDKVTLRVEDIGVTLEATITALRVQGSADNPRPIITPTIGTPLRTFVNRVAELNRRLELVTTR